MKDRETTARNPIIVVMGVSACGKSTIGQDLAMALGVEFLEGDDFHPKYNVTLMSTGTALTDRERLPWLQILQSELAAHERRNQSVVLSCSSLKRSYRELLASGSKRVLFVYLRISREQIYQRQAARKNHFMSTTLADSQFEALEEPSSDENHIDIDASQPEEQIIEQILSKLLH